ncbi:uncharacterized protein LOC141611733 isoform X2 [Silene latifolia]
MDIPDLHSPLPFSSTSSLSSARSESNQRPLAVSDRSWLVGEKTTQKILSVIQPTIDSESRRKEIIEYLQRLIVDSFGIKVFPFGSVPFKTYLPHGDIDLTAVSYYGTSQDLAAEICTLLENEEKNNANIPVKDVLCVPAQVRVVKCTVHDIAVDISFNQTAGLCALYFLEQVDQFIGKDHLFKLSVILIKAWCYYESRLLGGFHGLISTYALETMILHVINLFHSLLPSPVAVLYKFLEYYSTFDWKHYCIGVNGLVLISSLPEIEVVSLGNCDELLLTEEFLRSSREALLPSTGDVGTKSPTFPVKFLNILDPLRDDNNLGRSVSKGNFHRIKSALSYGAQRLSDILMLPCEKIGVGLEKFFKNTLERNGKGRRVDVVVPVHPYGSEISADDLLAGIQYDLWFDDYDTSATCHLWNYGWGEVGPGPTMQYDHNGYYDEESPPSSVGNLGVLVNHAASSEEKWKIRGNQINNSTSEEMWDPRGLRLNNGEKWKPRRATSSVDSSRTFRMNNPCYEEKWKSKTTPSSVDLYGGFHRKPKGTCAFIPQLAHYMQLNINLEEDGVEREDEKEADILDSQSSCTVNYSMDEFPLLPGSKPIPVRDITEVKSFKPTSPRSAVKQSDPDGSVLLDVLSDTVVMEAPEEPEEEKTVISVQLTDECEFPPLGSPAKPVMALCKKEFPPLRACLKSQKKSKC